MLTRIKFDNFTAFKTADIRFSPGLNILIGENGTGKTHIMKALYTACCVIDDKESRTFEQKLMAVFRPNSLGRLVHRAPGRNVGRVDIYRRSNNDDPSQAERSISCTISSKSNTTRRRWNEDLRNPATYIPVKDMLANAPGFRSLYNRKELDYEEVYADIIDRALIPPTKGKPTAERRRLTGLLSKAISGRVIEKNETFYLKNGSGELEFPLLAEGFRKLGLLYVLITNDSLTKGSVLFWDEPEANLNPKLSGELVEILIELQRLGVQIFIATHDYMLLKEFEMKASDNDDIMYHSLCISDGCIVHEAAATPDSLQCNPIRQAFEDLLDRQLSNF